MTLNSSKAIQKNDLNKLKATHETSNISSDESHIERKEEHVAKDLERQEVPQNYSNNLNTNVTISDSQQHSSPATVTSTNNNNNNNYSNFTFNFNIGSSPRASDT